MKNIFEKAYFGKVYETRDYRKVIFIHKKRNCYYLRDEFDYCIEVCCDGRTHYFDKDIDSPDDIISEWKKTIDEEELDKLACEEYPDYPLPFGEYESCDDLRDAFKAGYRKAKEL